MSQINIENVKPVENVTAPVDTVATKPAEIAAPQVQPAPTVEAPAEAVVEETEEVECEEEDESIDCSYVDSEGEDDEESIDDETQGEQAVEVAGPLPLKDEAAEAEQLAAFYGLRSTDDALARIGQGSTRRVDSTLSRYGELMNMDQEATSFYNNLSTEIEQLRNALNQGITKLISETGSVSDASGIDCIRGLMEDFLRIVLARSIVHAEYRDSTQVSARDILQALSVLGRPLYWELKDEAQAQPTEEAQQPADGASAMEEDGAMDVDDSEDEDEMESWEGKDDEPEDEQHCLEAPTFKRVVDVVNTWEGTGIADQGYAVLQAAVEDFLGQLIAASNKAAHFAGHTNKIGAEDVKFSQMMTQRH